MDFSENTDGYTQSDFLKYRDMFAMRDNSYYYDEMKDPDNYLGSIHDIYKTNVSWRNFEYLLLEKKIKVVKKPSTSTFGWFWGEKSNINDDLLYTFDRYKEILDKRVGKQNVSQYDRAQDNLRIYEQMQRKEQRKRGNLSGRIPAEPPPRNPLPQTSVQKRIQFKNNYPKIIEIFKDFVTEDTQQLNNILEHVLDEKNLPEPEAYDILIEEARKKYNFEKEKYNENVRNYTNLSTDMKKKTKEMGKNLDKFSLKLKPLIKDYNARNKARDEDLKSKILKKEKSRFELLAEEEEKIAKESNEKIQEKRKQEEEGEIRKEREKQAKLDKEKQIQKEIQNESARVFAEEKKRTEELQARQQELEMKKANEEIENLEYKIRDANSRYSMNKAKYNKLFSRLKNLENLEKKRNILQEKLKNKNLQIEERQKILKEKTELNEKLKNIDSLKNQVADLKSKIPDLSVFEQEKILRENEIAKLKKLNETSLREKNALLRSLEFEKMKEEIRIREEQRYQQEQREKEELKQFKIVFLKEKKIAEKKLNELFVTTRNKNSYIVEVKKNEQDFLDQTKFLEEIKSMRESKLKEKKLEISQKKLATLNLEKENLLKQKTYEAERQKLAQDSIQKDINDLNLQKELLQKSTAENKKILENTKKEISARQSEIEKNIKLNLQNVKLRENKILAKESKIKLDVFSTLSDVKEQTAIKLDVENTLENLKEEIIRKQDVSDLLSDTITHIADTEISEVENYNSYLESEIDFKKKLADVNLTQKKVLEILTEEKQSYINFLEETKSSYLKQILNAKRNITEKNIKIILTKGKENLSYVTSGMKFEIENLEKEKKIYERRKDFTKFQSDNFKKELELRKQEIETLKNIRLKVLETERKVARNEARSAIEDIVKNIEKTERDADVREKLDEILDDVEDIRISENARQKINSILDEIDNKEIHDSAEEKLNFILDKIEEHDNIDESKKALESIIDKVENKEIKKSVWLKLEDVLSYIEWEESLDNKKDFKSFSKYIQDIEDADSIKTEDDNDSIITDLESDFLDEEDDLDAFISSVKKHLSGEKKMEQFSKIDKILDETRKEDSKLKMDENIEMRERDKRPAPEDGIGETSFDEFSDYNFFINRIEDPILKEKTRENLTDIDSFEKESEKIPKIKNAYKAAINNALWNDQLDLNYWDGNIILDEKAKFDYEQKVNNVNTALGIDYDIHIDPNDPKVREFLDIKLTNSFSEKRGEINGYIYNGEKIISRNISRNFYFNYLKKSFVCQKFINELKDVINKTAKSQIVKESYFEGEAVKDCALQYIGELREEQSYQIDSAKNAKQMRDALRNSNDIDKEIKDIKKNLPFKMRLNIFRRTLSWRITKLLRFLWKHKGKSFSIIGGLLIGGIGVLLNQLGVIAVVHQLKKASASVRQYANDVHDMGKRIIQNVQAIYRVPGTIIGYVLIGLSIFLRVLYFATRLSGTYSSAAVFGALGVTFEALIYFEGSAEKMNEKVADAMEETGNILENAGIRVQKHIIKNSPRWYWDKPTNEKTVLEIVESGASKMVYRFAQGTQKVGKKVEEASEVVRNSLLYLKLFVLGTVIILAIMFVRNYIL